MKLINLNTLNRCRLLYVNFTWAKQLIKKVVFFFFFKKEGCFGGTSLAVQSLGLCASRGAKILHAAWAQPKKKGGQVAFISHPQRSQPLWLHPSKYCSSTPIIAFLPFGIKYFYFYEYSKRYTFSLSIFIWHNKICQLYWESIIFFLFIYFWLHWVFVAARGLFAVRRLLIAVASLVAEHRL